jgi:hypothetical protein
MWQPSSPPGREHRTEGKANTEVEEGGLAVDEAFESCFELRLPDSSCSDDRDND